MTDLNGTIYVITNEVTGLKYVGQTVYSSDHRIEEHIYAASTGSTTRIATAIRNYGWDAFSVMDVQVPADELDYWERFFIKHYDSFENGYNMDTGGKSGGFKIPKEEMRRMKEEWDFGCSIGDIAFGLGRDANTVSNILSAYGITAAQKRERATDFGDIPAKKAVQIDIKTGEIIKVYKSAGSASKELGHKSAGGISRCCNGTRKSALGYFWRWLEDVSEDDLVRGHYSGELVAGKGEQVISGSIPVVAISVQTNEVTCFRSISETAGSFGISGKTVSRAINSGTPCRGYRFLTGEAWLDERRREACFDKLNARSLADLKRMASHISRADNKLDLIIDILNYWFQVKETAE